MSLEEAFDPQRFRTLGHRWVDLLSGYLEQASGESEMPVLPVVPPAGMLDLVESGFSTEPNEDLLERLASLIAHSNHLHHRHYMGHQVATVLPQAALIEATNALLNNGMAVYEMGQMQTVMEHRVVQFLNRLLGFPDNAGGVLTHGGSIGNLTALLAARQAKAGCDVWTEGHTEKYAVLVSEQAHYCVARAVQIMGWGAAGAVAVETDDKFRVTRESLERGFASARESGRKVLAVVASSCTTATGSFDPLMEVADFCSEHDLWLHVDGAHGASLAFSSAHRDRLRGIDRADSVVWDLHKLALMPGLITAVLFRDNRRSYEAFAQEASYLFEPVDQQRECFDVGRRTLECTKRGLGALAFILIQTHGTRLFGESVDLLIQRTRELAEMITEEEDMEVVTYPEANILCFRLLPTGEADADELNALVRRRIVDSGEFYVVQTRLKSVVWLRVAIMNPATRGEDLKQLIQILKRLASQVVDEFM